MAALFANNSGAARPPGKEGPTGAWIPDDSGDVCNRCFKQVKAGLFTSGKHHCRRCGQMICGPCSTKKISLSRHGQGPEPVRVCDGCHAHEERFTACYSEYIPRLMQGTVFTKYPWQDSTGMGEFECITIFIPAPFKINYVYIVNLLHIYQLCSWCFLFIYYLLLFIYF